MSKSTGVRRMTAIAEITEALAEALRAEIPLVVMNARYDLSLLDRECRRHGLPTLTERLGHAPAPVIDPLVLDKHVDRYRKGKRALQALCGHYGVRLDGAHEAGADAAAAAGVARRIGEKYPAVAIPSPRALHDLQEQAAAEQAASFQAYLRRSGDPRAIVELALAADPVPGRGLSATGPAPAARPGREARPVAGPPRSEGIPPHRRVLVAQ